MNGIINVYKKKGLTSHDVVNKIRRIFNTKQVGHTGTLDPNAEGVLVICLNQATKLVQFLEQDIKTYRCELILGIETDTYDITGTVISEKQNLDITDEKIKKVIKSFIGKTKQVPPIYSAIKVDGKKLYEYARHNKIIEITPRDIEIFEIKVLDSIHNYGDYKAIYFEATVSKGTYIRSLCYDIGKKIGIPSTMGDLTRLRSGNFSIENSYTLEQIEQYNYKLVSLIDALNIPKIDFAENKELLHKANNGMKISVKAFEHNYEQFAAINNEQLIAVYKFQEENNFKYYKAVRVWK